MMEIKSNFFVAQLILVQLVCCAEAFVLLLMGKIHERCAPRSMIGVNNIILRAHLDFWLPVMTSDGLVSNKILVDKFIVLFLLFQDFTVWNVKKTCKSLWYAADPRNTYIEWFSET